jgi:hypothetical protein
MRRQKQMDLIKWSSLSLDFYKLSSDEKSVVFELSKLITDVVRTGANLKLALKLKRESFEEANLSLWNICKDIEAILGF